MALRPALAAAMLAVAALAATAQPAPPLECRLTAPASVAAGQPVPLRLRLHNPGGAAVQVLNWGTPFEGWFAAYVQVWRDGTELAYAGPSLKRGEPEREDYLRIGAGRSRVAVVNLAQAFDLGRSGRYRVQPRLTIHDAFIGAASAAPRPRERHVSLVLPCAPLSVEVRAPGASAPR